MKLESNHCQNKANEQTNERKKHMQKNTNRIIQIFGGNNNTHQSNWSKMKHIFICRFFLWFCQSVSYFFSSCFVDSHSIKLIWFEILGFVVCNNQLLSLLWCSWVFGIVYHGQAITECTIYYCLILVRVYCCFFFFIGFVEIQTPSAINQYKQLE